MAEKMDVICPHCRQKQTPHPWLFAHWNDRLTGTCDNPECGKKFAFKSGKTWKERKSNG